MKYSAKQREIGEKEKFFVHFRCPNASHELEQQHSHSAVSTFWTLYKFLWSPWAFVSRSTDTILLLVQKWTIPVIIYSFPFLLSRRVFYSNASCCNLRFRLEIVFIFSLDSREESFRCRPSTRGVRIYIFGQKERIVHWAQRHRQDTKCLVFGPRRHCALCAISTLFSLSLSLSGFFRHVILWSSRTKDCILFSFEKVYDGEKQEFHK